MFYEPDPQIKEFISPYTQLARERFAPRAQKLDESAEFPAADFDDLFEEGLFAPAAAPEFGGLGLRPGNNGYALWMITKELAKVDLSLARCWEGHVNSQVLISSMGTPEQQARWFEGITKRQDLWVAWSGEPQTRVKGQKRKIGTTLEKVPGGYLVHGNKVFATSAGHADKAILLVNAEGPGGARHSDAPSESLLLLVCDLSDPSVSFDDSWWDPIGMRATVSYRVQFDGTFIPDDNLLGYPGQYLTESWQTRFSPHYGASFLGAAEGAFDHVASQLEERRSSIDAYVEHRFADMAMNLQSGHLWLKHVSDLWDAGREPQAKAAGNQTRYLLEKWATETVDSAIRICGARSLMRPSALERTFRDLSIYVRHDNIDQVLATIGKELLGESCDQSFFSPKSDETRNEEDRVAAR